MGFIDLHVHSTVSDGTFTPTELVNYACEKGLYAFALTDHDSVGGIDEAMAAAAHLPVRVIAGIEFSCPYKGREVHVLGYNFNHKNTAIIEALNRLTLARDDRNEKMCGLLLKQGFDISVEKLKNRFKSVNISRGDIANYLLDEGYVKTKAEAFEKYIGLTCPCYVPRYKLQMEAVVKLITGAGGVCSLAHPVKYRLNDQQLEELLGTAKDAGIKCLEAIYSENSFDDEIKYKDLAKKYGFLITGGSDFHGSVKPKIDLGTGCGNLMIPQDILKNIENVRRK